MSIEKDHGCYQEFTRTPQEEKIIRDRKRLDNLEKRVKEICEEIKEIKECLSHLGGSDE